MPTPDRCVHVWLPALDQFDATHPLRPWLPRADPMADGAKGYLGGLAHHFVGVTPELPAAAITRQFLAGDAGHDIWLSADPGWVQPDMNGVRLMACGHMQLSASEAQALADTVRPVFDEAQMQLEVSAPDHWHVRVPVGTSLPHFATPEQALGEDLVDHLPPGAEGRRWRVMLNDLQVTLHQHPLNTQRRGRGQSPVNCVWLWGGGRLADPPASNLFGVISDDVLLRALAAHAGVAEQARTAPAIAAATAGWLIDLQDLPARELADHWWPALSAVLAEQTVLLHFASGERWCRKPWHRWRIWRRGGC